MLDPLSNIRILCNLWVRKLLVSLWINRYIPRQYHLEECTVHQGNLSLCHPISSSLGSRVLVLTIVGVTSEVEEEVDSLRCLTCLIFSSIGVG